MSEYFMLLEEIEGSNADNTFTYLTEGDEGIFQKIKNWFMGIVKKVKDWINRIIGKLTGKGNVPNPKKFNDAIFAISMATMVVFKSDDAINPKIDTVKEENKKIQDFIKEFPEMDKTHNVVSSDKLKSTFATTTNKLDEIIKSFNTLQKNGTPPLDSLKKLIAELNKTVGLVAKVAGLYMKVANGKA